MDLPALERPYSLGDSNGWKPPQQPYEEPMSLSQPVFSQPAAAPAATSASAYPPSLSLSAPISRPSSKELASLCLRLELSGVLSGRPKRELVALLQANDWALERAVEAYFREEQARAEEEEEDLFNEVEEKSNGSGGVKEEPNAAGGAASAAASSSQPAFVTPARVNITVRSDSGESQLYAEVNSSKPLSKLMADFIARIARRRCEFFCRGKLVAESDTPAALGMHKSDTLEARAPARTKRAFHVAGAGAEPSAAMVAAAESLKAAAAAASNGAPSADPTFKRAKSELDSSPGSAAAPAAAASATAVPAAPAFRAPWVELQLGSVDFWILQNRTLVDEKGNRSQCPPTMLALSSFVRELRAQSWSGGIRRRHPDVVCQEAEAIGADVVQTQLLAEEETRLKSRENSALIDMLKPLSMHPQAVRGHVMLVESIAGCECDKPDCRQGRDHAYHQMRLTLALLPGAHDDIIPYGNRLLPLLCPELAPLIEAALPSGQAHPDRAQLHSLLDLSVRTRFKQAPEPFLMEVEDAMEDEEEKKSEPPAAAAAASSFSSSAAAAAAAPAAPAVHLSEFDRLRAEWGLPLDPPEEDLSGPTTDALLALSDRELSARCKLAVTLRDYQQQTVLWALKQETGVRSMSDPYWVHFEIGKQTVWYSPFLQAIRFLPPPQTRGGLISEEMGLGKTVEMLALIHLNPAKGPAGAPCASLGSPLPPHSAPRPAGLVAACSTLIIAPTSLVGQWYSEIEKRSAGEKLKVLCWYGSSRTQDVQRIIQYDVVLTTFGIVAAELVKQNKKTAAAAAAAASGAAVNGDDGAASSSAAAAAAPSGPAEISPLHRIDWHRVIVDESHSLKSRVSRQSRNVLTLHSPRKWLLSGTPINLQIDDLFHQFAFFGMPVFNDAPILNMVRHHAFGFKHESRVDEFTKLEAFGLLRHIMQSTVIRHRKTQKFNGRSELIALPPRHMDTIKVEFTPEERAGYDKMSVGARRVVILRLTLSLRGLVLTHVCVCCCRFEFARSRFQDLPSNRRSFQILSLLLPVRQACSAGHHDLNEILESLKAIQQREEESRLAAAEAKDASIKLSLAQQAYNDGECSICLDIIEDALMTPCRHQVSGGSELQGPQARNQECDLLTIVMFSCLCVVLQRVHLASGLEARAARVSAVQTAIHEEGSQQAGAARRGQIG